MTTPKPITNDDGTVYLPGSDADSDPIPWLSAGDYEWATRPHKTPTPGSD